MAKFIEVIVCENTNKNNILLASGHVWRAININCIHSVLPMPLELLPEGADQTKFCIIRIQNWGDENALIVKHSYFQVIEKIKDA